MIQHFKAAHADAPRDIKYRVTVNNDTKSVRSWVEREFGAEGKLAGAFGTVQDITDKMQMYAAFRESEERLRIILRERLPTASSLSMSKA